MQADDPGVKILGTLFGSLFATQGLEAEKQTELQIQACLEILLFDPNPTPGVKVTAKALQRLITGGDPAQSLEQRFSDEVISKFLSRIDPRLGTAKSILERLGPLLRSAGK